MKRVVISLFLKILKLFGPGKSGPVPVSAVSRIILFRFGGIGDVIVLTGLIRSLRRVYSDADITVVTSRLCAPMFDHNPDVDHLMIREKIQWTANVARNVHFFLELRRMSAIPYDLAFFMHNDFYSLLYALFFRARYKIGFDTNDRGYDFALTHRAPIYASAHPFRERHESRHLNAHFHDLLGAVHAGDMVLSAPHICISHAETEEACEWAMEKGLTKPIVVVAPGGTVSVKIWPILRFLQFARRCVNELDASVLVLGGSGEAGFRALFSSRDDRLYFAAGERSLRESISLLSFADVVVGSDTAMMHAAAALGVPTVAIFGPTPSAVYGYEGGNQVILKASLDCVPCNQEHCRLLAPAEKLGTPPCMAAIEVEDVFRMTTKLLSASVEKVIA